MNTALTLLAAFALVLLNAMFVAAEFAFVRIRATRLEVLAQSGATSAKSAMFGLDNLEDYLSVCQLGITLASLGLGWLGEPAAAAVLKPTLAWLGVDNPTVVHTLSVAVGFVVITFAHVTFGELAPKNLAIRSAETTVLRLALPMRVCHVLFLPAVKLLNVAARVILKLLGASKLHDSPAHSAQELKMLVAESRDNGQLDADEERFLTNIFNLDRRVARDVMVHRTKVVTLGADETVEAAVALMRDHGHTRLPVYDRNKDDLIGFIHAKDLLLTGGRSELRSLVRPAPYIYDHMNIRDVLKLMRQKQIWLGFVWDEYGSWQGLLTMEDVVEAVLGEIQDEFDREEPLIELLPDGSALVMTTVSLDELDRNLPLKLKPDSEERYRSLAALLADRFGETPRVGVVWTGYGADFEAVEVNGPAVERVKVRACPEEPDEPADGWTE
ncbi:MAG: hemolysin family protein [Deltaproteobacteria bacterium]|jgi:CBS domain containing-hemolysin-like protein|nr:hemolysin family protein [Deltaproteobacteria bacterium]